MSRAKPPALEASRSKARMATGPLLVHHIWIGLPDTPGQLSDLSKNCLASWDPLPQMLWVVQPLHPADATWARKHCPNLAVMPVAQVMPIDRIAAWLHGRVAVQIVKDILSMAILEAHGGLYTDLDIFWTGRLPMLVNGYWLPLEPHRLSGHAFCRKSDRVTLACFAMPKGAELARGLVAKWVKTWDAWADKEAAAEEPFDWTAAAVQTSLWMQNTRQFHEATERLALEQAYVLPIYAMPWGKTLKAADIPAIQSGKSNVPVVCQPLDYTVPYPVPSCIDVEQLACTVNLWARQWDTSVQQWALDFLSGVRARLLAKNSRPVQTMPRAIPKSAARTRSAEKAQPKESRPLEEPRSSNGPRPSKAPRSAKAWPSEESRLAAEPGTIGHPEQARPEAEPSSSGHPQVRPEELESLHILLAPFLGLAASHRLQAEAHEVAARLPQCTSSSSSCSSQAVRPDWAAGLILYVGLPRLAQLGREQLQQVLGSRFARAVQAMQLWVQYFSPELGSE
jgi:hypothetical protein